MKYLMLLFAILLTGCATLKPNRATVLTVGAVLNTADAAMQTWATYVVAEEKRINTLPVEDQPYARVELLKREGRVQNAYGHYLKAINSAKVALKTALVNPSEAPASGQLTSALSHLITVATP